MGLRYSTKGWLAVGGVVAAVEVMAPNGEELLSSAMDRWRAHRIGKYIATAVILSVASHLLRVMPPQTDWLTLAFRWKDTKAQSVR